MGAEPCAHRLRMAARAVLDGASARPARFNRVLHRAGSVGESRAPVHDSGSSLWNPIPIRASGRASTVVAESASGVVAVVDGLRCQAEVGAIDPATRAGEAVKTARPVVESELFEQLARAAPSAWARICER